MNIFNKNRGWDKSPSLSIIFGLSSKTQWLSGLYYADFISFYSPTQLCGGGTKKSNSNELPISVPLSICIDMIARGEQGLTIFKLKSTF
ncbi:Peptide deformylase [Streptococcus sp. ZB199]|nr:Peptide deformylase [Streptococcus sp. ZB199]